jgi:biopolymer transport protein ExbD
MAFSVGASNGRGSGLGGRRRFGAGVGTLSEMNVVPLVDVVLVLLIVFMLTAHVMEFGMEINVPQVKETRETVEDIPVINITSDGRISLNEKPVNINALSGELASRFHNPKSVLVRPDREAKYEQIAQILSQLNEAKIPNIKLAAQPQDAATRRR